VTVEPGAGHGGLVDVRLIIHHVSDADCSLISVCVHEHTFPVIVCGPVLTSAQPNTHPTTTATV